MSDEPESPLDPTALESLLSRGEAAEVVRRCAALGERSAALENLYGRALVARGDLTGAEGAFLRSHALDPSDPRPLSNLGNLLAARGETEGALARYREALTLRPDAPRTLVNYGIALAATGLHADAKDAFERALALEPGLANARIGLARAVGQLEGPAQALASIEAASRASPASAPLLAELGGVLTGLGRLDEAIGPLERAAAASPGDPAILATLGGCLRQRGELSRAVGALRSAIERRPMEARFHVSLGLALGELGESHAAVDELAVAERLSRHDPEVGSALLAAMLHDDRQTAASLGAASRAWGERVTSRAPSAAPGRASRAGDRLRVGYLSAHFRTHVIMNFLSGVLAAHDRERFDFVLLSCGESADGVTEQLRRDYPLSDLRGLSDEAFRGAVRALDLDVLVELDGHTGSASETRLAALATKVAPVQVSYLGYPSSTGLASFDYRLTDELADPPGSEAEFVEQLHRLPSCAWAYTPFVRLDPGERVPGGRGTVFGCFSRLEKIGEETLRAWRRILERCPDAALVLKARALRDEGARARVLGVLGAEVSARVELRPWVGTLVEHYESYRSVDVALDTFPYNGTTTICDALFMGVPMVSRYGETSASRVGRALLTTAGLGHLAAPTFDAYVELATTLASPAARPSRAEVSRRARGSALGDPTRLARQLEAAYRAMVERKADIA